MTNNVNKPEALRLADALDAGENFYHESSLRRDEKLANVAEEAAAELRRLHEANEAFGKRQEWWNERMFELERQRDELLAALVSFTKSEYIRHQHPKRFAAAIAAIAKATGTR